MVKLGRLWHGNDRRPMPGRSCSVILDPTNIQRPMSDAIRLVGSNDSIDWLLESKKSISWDIILLFSNLFFVLEIILFRFKGVSNFLNPQFSARCALCLLVVPLPLEYFPKQKVSTPCRQGRVWTSVMFLLNIVIVGQSKPWIRSLNAEHQSYKTCWPLILYA